MKKYFFLFIFLMNCSFGSAELTLSVSSQQTEILAVEAFFLDLMIENTDEKKSEEINPALALEYDYLRIWVAYEKEDFQEYRHGSVVDAVLPVLALEPKKVLREQVILLYNDHSQSFIFERPGSYRVKASFWHALAGKSLESNVIAVDVTEPRGKDKKALGLFKGVKQSQLVIFNYQDKEAVGKFEKLIHGYSKSPYAMYAAWALGKMYFEQIRREMVAQDSKGFDKAINYFVKVLALDTPRPIREESLFYAAWIYGLKKDFGKTKEYLQQLLIQFPETKFESSAQGMLKEIEMNEQP